MTTKSPLIGTSAHSIIIDDCDDGIKERDTIIRDAMKKFFAPKYTATLTRRTYPSGTYHIVLKEGGVWTPVTLTEKDVTDAMDRTSTHYGKVIIAGCPLKLTAIKHPNDTIYDFVLNDFRPVPAKTIDDIRRALDKLNSDSILPGKLESTKALDMKSTFSATMAAPSTKYAY